MTDTTDIAALREASEIGESSDWMTWPKVDPAKLKQVLNLLEAERQRADYAVKVKDNDEQTALYWAKIAAEALAEIAALKAKLANPVVLPAKLPDEGYGGEAVRNWWRNKTVTDCARRIAEAGFTVKGE